MESIRRLIGDNFVVDYTKIEEHKYAHRCKISTQCISCHIWYMLSVDALVKRISSNKLPYICRKCVITIKMSESSTKKKCKDASKKLWDNYIIKQAFIDRSNKTKFLNRLDKAFDD